MGNAENAKAKHRGRASEYRYRETISECITENNFKIDCDYMN